MTQPDAGSPNQARDPQGDPSPQVGRPMEPGREPHARAVDWRLAGEAVARKRVAALLQLSRVDVGSDVPGGGAV